MKSVRVFISYSHDSSQHAERVLALANRLRAEGVDAWIDRYEMNPAEGWPRWMQAQIEQADVIVLICTPTFQRRFDGKEAPAIGRGVTWEGLLATQLLYEASTRNERIVPVVFEGAGEDSIPMAIRPFQSYRLPDGYDEFYRRLTGQPEVMAPTVGRLRPMPTRDGRGAAETGVDDHAPVGLPKNQTPGTSLAPIAPRSAGMPDETYIAPPSLSGHPGVVASTATRVASQWLRQ